MDLSVVIVSWNVREKLRQNLLALLNSQGDFSFEVFVVDNASSNGTAEMVRQDFLRVGQKDFEVKAKRFHGLELIANNENLGFAKANNQALAKAKGDFLLLLNPDMLVRPDTLEKVLAWARNNPNSGVTGCRLVSEKGEVVKQVRRFPTFCDQLAIVLKLPHFFPHILDDYLRSDFDYSRAGRVDSVRGAFFMIRREIFKKVGFLDERFFVWFEEVDYCRRVKEAGSEVWYTPAAECVDFIGQSFGQLPRGKTQAYFRDSMLKYFRKHHSFWQYFFLRLAWSVSAVLMWVALKLDFKPRAKT